MATTITINDKPHSSFEIDRFVRIELARNWGDPWVLHPELEASDLVLQSVSQGIDRFAFKRRCGMLRHPYETADVGPHTWKPWTDSDIEGSWVRVSWIEDAGWVGSLSGLMQTISPVDPDSQEPDENGKILYVAFIGQIQTPSVELSGGGITDPVEEKIIQTGEQNYYAYGPADYLRRTPMTVSLVDAWRGDIFEAEYPEPYAIDWIMRPNFNSQGDPVKNRSGWKFDPPKDEDGNPFGEKTYIFMEDNDTPTSEIWHTSDYAVYLGRLMNKPNKPYFQFEIESELKEYLENDSLNIELDTAENIFDVLKKMFPTKLGMDFCIRPIFQEIDRKLSTSFAIRVFSLAEADGTWEGKTFPKPQTLLNFNISDTHSLGGNVSVSGNQENRYRHFRLLGNRIKVACTFSLGDQHGPGFPRLVPGWSKELEEEYCKALYWASDNLPDKYPDGTEISGDDPAEVLEEKIKVAAEVNDEYRKQEKFRDVFTLFIPEENFKPEEFQANPKFNKKGEFETGGADEYQITERETLQELPRWKKDKDEKNTEQAELAGWFFLSWWLPPRLPVPEGSESNPDQKKDSIGCMRSLEMHGITAKAIPRGLGVRFVMDVQHIWRDSWNDWYPTKVRPLIYNDGPNISYKNTIVTIAWENDFRIAFSGEDEGANEDLGTLSVEDKNAELWYYAPCTFFGELDQYGFPVFCAEAKYDNGKVSFWEEEEESESDGEDDDEEGDGGPPFDPEKQIGRNDLDSLKSQMAAIMARHGRRPRAVIPLKGTWPAVQLIGMAVDKYKDAEVTLRPKTVVTRVQLTFGEGRTTTIHAGNVR